MTIEKAFKLYIDFDVLESIAYRWGLQDKSIGKIRFYAGVGNKPYVLLFSFSSPAIEGFWGDCMNGLRDWKSGWVELKEACLRKDSQNIQNWLIFAHDESENQYLTIDYLLRNGKNTDYLKKKTEDVFNDASNLLPGGIRLTKDDLVGDSWILTESGFKKHVLDVEPKTIYQTEHSPAKKQKPNLFDKYVRLANEFMAQKKERTGQAPLKDELVTHMEDVLRKNNEALGPKAALPDAAFRKVWKTIPSELKRGIGEKTRPLRK